VDPVVTLKETGAIVDQAEQLHTPLEYSCFSHITVPFLFVSCDRSM